MRYCHLTRQRVKCTVIKDLADKPHILMSGDNTPVVYRYAAALLTSVLKSKKSVIASIGRSYAVIPVYAENPALLVQALFRPTSLINTQKIHHPKFSDGALRTPKGSCRTPRFIQTENGRQHRTASRCVTP